MKRVLFFREYNVYTGGHLKLWDYFQHVLATPGYEARISFTANSKWDESNPWHQARELVLGPDEPWNEFPPDILFLEGTDWPRLPEAWRAHAPVPVLNLIQHVRHGDPANERYAFLPHRAIRICVGMEIQEVLKNTGRINGPIFAVPNGIDLSSLPPAMPLENRPVDILVGGLKHPDAGRKLKARLERLGGKALNLFNREFATLNVQVLDKPLLRDEYLKALAEAKIAVFLPNPTEGFYLPALEAMALGTLVVCPDVVGNRSFCLDGHNCSRPEYTTDALVEAVKRILRLTPGEKNGWRQNALATASQYDIKREREQFQSILHQASTLWQS